MTAPASTPLVYVLAGEPSGDNLGGRIMQALKARAAVPLSFVGVGGERMVGEGLETLVPLSELSIMGLAEILPHVPRMYRLIYRLAADIRARRPAVVLTIDNTAFNFAVANRARGYGIPLVHLNAPKVWAYRPGRVRRVARYYDHLLCLLPFEPPYFHRVGMPASFIGHPVVESGADRGEGRRFRARHDIPAAATLLCVLPGSRGGELERLLPDFGGAVAQLAEARPGLRVIVPTVRAQESRVRAAVAVWPLNPIVVVDESEKFDAFAASDVALAASGTVSLELNLARVPTVIAYRVSAVSAALVRAMVRVRHITIANLVLGDRSVIPEFTQEDCTPEKLSRAVLALLDDPAAAAEQVRQAGEAMRALGYGGPPPSLRAAEILLDVAGIARRPRSSTIAAGDAAACA
ncbi:MAG: lipid-A-disaccharide synthase [Alphaproteobacteria bacterium]|nr:lipid-A-disaccharide synthase [Alphaproteobacteria bacterium]